MGNARHAAGRPSRRKGKSATSLPRNRFSDVGSSEVNARHASPASGRHGRKNSRARLEEDEELLLRLRPPAAAATRINVMRRAFDSRENKYSKMHQAEQIVPRNQRTISSSSRRLVEVQLLFEQLVPHAQQLLAVMLGEKKAPRSSTHSCIPRFGRTGPANQRLAKGQRASPEPQPAAPATPRCPPLWK